METFLKYFVEIWLVDLMPKFALYIRSNWNHNIDRRITNDLEGWHYALNKVADQNHPSIL